MHLLHIHRLCKEFRSQFGEKIRAIHDLELSIEQGEIFGLLGPNGAGKSTLLSLIMGFYRPTSGSIIVMGQEKLDADLRRTIGYMPEEFNFYRFMTGRSLLLFFATLQQIAMPDRDEHIESLLHTFGLKKHEGLAISEYSKGLQQRLGLAVAMMGSPKLLLLDEPTSGLDPESRAELRETLLKLKAEGLTLLISSHLLSEIELICDRVGILNEGVLIKQDAPSRIVHSEPRSVAKVEFAESQGLEDFTKLGYEMSAVSGEQATVYLSKMEKNKFLKDLADHKGQLLELANQKETLEAAFIRLVKETKGGSDLIHRDDKRF